ncbi:VanZ family protein [Isoptericola haloaureus]|uniref:VanZ family protein n=1 Tax=Isoptericola haloaureus TaxID=1542902 RepID=A0ABU7Z7D3_9MICO
MDDRSETPRRDTTARDVTWALAALTYLGFLALLTLTPRPWGREVDQVPWGVLNPAAWLSSATWTTGTAREFVLNILLFVPAGLLAARFRGAWGLGAAVLLTGAVEVAQIPLANRLSDPRDIVANVGGALVGLALGAASRSGAPPPPPTGRATADPSAPEGDRRSMY